jgi:tetratricopeptide (TPR) repeat protein
MQQVEALKTALASRNRAGANRAVAALLDGKAPLGPQWRGIAELMRVSGELTLAHRAMDAFVAAAGRTPAAVYAKVVLLTQSGRQQEAHDLLSTLPENVPTPAGRAYVLGNIEMTLGRVEAARTHLLAALRHQPGWGPGWLTLAAAVNFASDPLAEQLLAEEAAAQSQPQGDLARFYYALGKLHADRGDAPEAFAAFARGAELLRRETPYSRQGNAANAAQAMQGYEPAFFDRIGSAARRDTSRPIFVTGLPRSGTTLVEQILASHSAVRDGGELNLIQHIAVQAGGVSGTAIDAYVAGGGSLDDMAALYLHLLDERFGAEGRIVDKTVDASRFVGIIAAALPDAPIIWMERDPMDNAWSCFRTFFIHGVAWSYDLDDIAHHFRLEDDLRAFWKARLGSQLLVVPYGALVDDAEGWTRRILQHCGLAEEAAAYAPHKTERLVATASSLQVRRPINRDGMGVAAPYAEMMTPFTRAYRA